MALSYLAVHDAMVNYHSATELSASRSAFCGFGTPEHMQLPSFDGLTCGLLDPGVGIALTCYTR